MSSDTRYSIILSRRAALIHDVLRWRDDTDRGPKSLLPAVSPQDENDLYFHRPRVLGHIRRGFRSSMLWSGGGITIGDPFKLDASCHGCYHPHSPSVMRFGRDSTIPPSTPQFRQPFPDPPSSCPQGLSSSMWEPARFQTLKH